jgi:hypothetical protein
MKYLIVLIFMASCASGDMQPYEYDLEIAARYDDGQIIRKSFQITSITKANKAGEIVLFNDGCIIQVSGNKKLDCGIIAYGVLKFDCLNCRQ